MDSSSTLTRGSSSTAVTARTGCPAGSKVVAILGGGPTGLGAAHYLTQPSSPQGLTTHIFEAQPHAGGFHQSLEIDGHWVDTGSFFYPIRTGTGYSFVNIIPETFKSVDNLRLGVYFNGRYNRFPLPWKFVLQSLKPFPQFSSVIAPAAPMGRSWYDSLQLQLTKRLTHGLSANVNRCFDDACQVRRSV